ncbi:MAG: hypothetical protein ABI460_13800 [Caldimonas sp.]
MERVSIPALSSSRMVWALCLAFAAPLFARLGYRPHAWFFYDGDETLGADELSTVASCLYGGRSQMSAASWSQLRAAEPGSLEAGRDGLLCVFEGSGGERLDQATVVANMWLDRTPPPEVRTTDRAALTIITAAKRFDPALVRARWGDGKLWVLSVPAGAGAGRGIFNDPPAAGPESASAQLAIAAMQSDGQVGVRWLSWLNWWGVDLANLCEFGEAPKYPGRSPETNLELADLTRLFGAVAYAGEYATMEGLTGWPAGTAQRVAAEMFAAWSQANLELVARRKP